MSGIENVNEAQHCYFNALLMCMTINETLLQDLQHDNVNHISNIGISLCSVVKQSIQLKTSMLGFCWMYKINIPFESS